MFQLFGLFNVYMQVVLTILTTTIKLFIITYYWYDVSCINTSWILYVLTNTKGKLIDIISSSMIGPQTK